jgi:hypothetical protein
LGCSKCRKKILVLTAETQDLRWRQILKGDRSAPNGLSELDESLHVTLVTGMRQDLPIQDIWSWSPSESKLGSKFPGKHCLLHRGHPIQESPGENSLKM